MRKIIGIGIATVALAVSVVPASADYQTFAAKCQADGYPIVADGKGGYMCNPPGVPAPVGGSVDPVLAIFYQKCAADGGTVYTAADWNQMGKSPHLQPGELRCDTSTAGRITYN